MQLHALVKKQSETLKQCPVGSADWSTMAKNMKRLSVIALMENSVPLKKGENLWASSRYSVRALIETGRHLQCIPILNSFYKWRVETLANPSKIEEAAREGAVPLSEMTRRIEQFEATLGLVTFCLLNTYDALQTMSAPSLVEHCSYVISSAVAHPELYLSHPLKDKTQPILCLLYIYEILRLGEDVPNDKSFYQAIVDGKLFSLSLRFLNAHHDTIPQAQLSVCLEALALIAGHELFDLNEHIKISTKTDAYAGASSSSTPSDQPTSSSSTPSSQPLPDDGSAGVSLCQTFKASVLDPFITKNPGRRPGLQPLTRAINKAK
ncbi:uncharacterized protein MONOS_10665 [Monocercomonoides exilis]|uniref:uncharacterized protein n=1 Tax=Monocercomonoides exilis TaxID=2049356 RepID=UPI00355A8BD0|nr:hypothetical protein MONOS_10665 [Monocercomonoides exilis]|eukprot:MONOS_10665.1-p1 / transcript=MONOS_10665.1 / gene=MONOS_10665 / organism=Monocercomonoides_exilis_PA203 / gene_product=unspecified product / transcript_product=unspecified product / location=Mono_scaffold00493:15988-17413(-) / protein_length=322 / sequence_SO=supercontig / SO=protein_coding / is_pseudo=false